MQPCLSLELQNKYKLNSDIFKETYLKKLLFEITFLFLPVRILRIYLSLSVIALFSNIKNIPFSIDSINKEKLSQLLKITFNEEILIIPGYTFIWLWKEDLLNEIIAVNGQQFLFKDFIINDKLFLAHTHLVIDKIIERLPKVFKFKLGLLNKKKYLHFRNALTKNIIYSFSK